MLKSDQDRYYIIYIYFFKKLWLYITFVIQEKYNMPIFLIIIIKEHAFLTDMKTKVIFIVEIISVIDVSGYTER